MLKFCLHYLILFILIFFIKENVCRTSESLKINFPHGGILVGRYLTTLNGKGMRAFMGVPYAEPPLKKLRFKPPVPALPWAGKKYAIKDSPICIQRDPFRRDQMIEGSEDCLYLNVYTPEKANFNSRLPVMVFFHGGGWQCGSGISDFYGPDYLLDHDVIYVSGNFRLGPLGFLSTETADCPGNNGLKDQVEILKWIQKNIELFGGDPNSVTIFGESAGGASVSYLMVSDLSKGLFHKGISQSGVYYNPWAQPAHKNVAANRAKTLAKLMDCEKKNWNEIIKCLQQKDAEKITAALYDYFIWDYDPMIPFPPVVEPDLPGAFLTKHPLDIETPHSLSIPWMAGLTSEEGALKAAPLLNMPGVLNEFKERFEEVLPISLNYDHHSKIVQNEITNQIKQFYFGGDISIISKKYHQNLTNLYTDGWFLAGIDKYLRKRLNSPKNKFGPTYVYLFDHKGAASLTEIFKGGQDDYYGVCHADELQYLFPLGKHLFVSAIPTIEDRKIRDTLLDLWVNFAKYGNPTPSTNTKLNFKWKPADSYPVKYVKIGTQNLNNWVLITEEKGLLQERSDFWNNLKIHLPTLAYLKDEL